MPERCGDDHQQHALLLKPCSLSPPNVRPGLLAADERRPEGRAKSIALLVGRLLVALLLLFAGASQVSGHARSSAVAEASANDAGGALEQRSYAVGREGCRKLLCESVLTPFSDAVCDPNLGTDTCNPGPLERMEQRVSDVVVRSIGGVVLLHCDIHTPK